MGNIAYTATVDDEHTATATAEYSSSGSEVSVSIRHGVIKVSVNGEVQAAFGTEEISAVGDFLDRHGNYQHIFK